MSHEKKLLTTKSSKNDQLFSDGLWPIHLKPLPDELLSSWIIRLAHAHHYKVQTFSKLVFGCDENLWNRDIDRCKNEEILVRLERITGARHEEVVETTFNAYEGLIYEGVSTGGISQWLMPLGIHGRTRTLPGLCYCPVCLSLDSHPYFRKEWRLAYKTICTKHHVYLIEECPKCHEVIIPHRSDVKLRGIYPIENQSVYCWKCGYNLMQSPIELCHNEELLSIDSMIENGLCEGYVYVSGENIKTLAFMIGLREIITGLYGNESLRRMRYKCKKENISNVQFECMRLRNRCEVMKSISRLLCSWPYKFNEMIKNKNIRYSDLVKSGHTLPYWYQKVVNKVKSDNYVVSRQEKDALIEFVERKRGIYTNHSAKEITKRDISEYANIKLSRNVKIDVFEDLMVSYDHRIASTIDTEKRISLLREKIMWATGKVLSLSQKSLVGLKVDTINIHSEGESRADFFGLPLTKDDVIEWLNWYVKNARSKLKPIESCDYIFTSVKNRGQLNVKVVSQLFRCAIASAGLKREIKSYKDWVRGEY